MKFLSVLWLCLIFSIPICTQESTSTTEWVSSTGTTFVSDFLNNFTTDSTFPTIDSATSQSTSTMNFSKETEPTQSCYPPNAYISFTTNEKIALAKYCFKWRHSDAQVLALLDCDRIMFANAKQDRCTPELVEMRAVFDELLTNFQMNQLADQSLAHFCVTAQLADDWTQEQCSEFYYRLVFPTNISLLLQRTQNRQNLYQEHLAGICVDLTRPEAASKLCHYYNLKRVSDCFLASVKNSFCKVVEHGIVHRQASGIPNYYNRLYTLYSQMKSEYQKKQLQAIECFEDHRNDGADQCKGINWHRRAPLTAVEVKVFAFYDRLVELNPTVYTTPTTTLASATILETTTNLDIYTTID